MNKSQFADLLQSMGISLDYIEDPARLSQHLLDKTKHLAKIIQHAPGTLRAPYRENLELTAKSFGFKDWYEYEKTLSSIKDLKESSSVPYAKLATAVPLLINFKDETDTGSKISAFEQLLSTLNVRYSSYFPSQVLEVLLYKFFGIHSIDAIVKSAYGHDPAPAPLYTFEVFNSHGHFEASWEAMDLNDETDPDLQSELGPKYLSKMQGLIKKHPNYLRGYLNIISTFGVCADYLKFSHLINSGVKVAESMISADFKGKIEWHEGENSVYFRLLHSQMISHAIQGKYKSAARIARKLLRLNPNDNVGARFSLPIYLALTNDFRSATAFCKNESRLYQDGDVLLNDSMILMMQGHYAESVSKLIQAVIAVPLLLYVLRGEPLPSMKDADKNNQVRGLVPDADAINITLLTVMGKFPGYQKTIDQVIASSKLKSVMDASGKDYSKIKKMPKSSVSDEAVIDVFADFYKKYEAISVGLGREISSEIDWSVLQG